MKLKLTGIGCWVFLMALLFSCDEGKIYPDTTIETGRTATLALSFKGLGAWPKKNYLCFAAFDEKGAPALVKRILNPNNETEQVKITLNGLPESTKEVGVAVISNGEDVIYTYFTYPAEPAEESVAVPSQVLDLALFDRVQGQVFNQNCVACHGGSTHLSGNLDLTVGKAYSALVEAPAPLSPEGWLYVAPGNPDESYLLEILENNDYHKDMFNSTGKQEVIGLIKTWISEGAKE